MSIWDLHGGLQSLALGPLRQLQAWTSNDTPFASWLPPLPRVEQSLLPFSGCGLYVVTSHHKEMQAELRLHRSSTQSLQIADSLHFTFSLARLSSQPSSHPPERSPPGLASIHSVLKNHSDLPHWSQQCPAAAELTHGAAAAVSAFCLRCSYYRNCPHAALPARFSRSLRQGVEVTLGRRRSEYEGRLAAQNDCLYLKL